MKSFVIGMLFAGAVTLAPHPVHAASATAHPAKAAMAAKTANVESKFATVNGVKLHYLIAGKGSPVLLLHGFAETSHMWLPLIAELSATHTVIAPDLRGYGDSEKPATGYLKKDLAKDVHALMDSLGDHRIRLVGHDIGLMVAYAYAAQYPAEVESIVLMDAFLPGVGNWKEVWLLRDLWHFHFYGKTPLALVSGRERIYLEHFWNDFAADPKHSIPEADRQFYARKYALPGATQAGFETFHAFEQDAKDFEAFSATKLPMPMLVLTGEKASGHGLIDQAQLVATSVRGVVVPGSGHWLMEEATAFVVPQLVEFLNQPAAASTASTTSTTSTASTAALVPGTSGAAGMKTEVLKGDPTKIGLYTLLLRVPAHTRIEAHRHPDDRVATVLSGSWYFGYGDRFDETKLAPKAPGSFYVETPSQLHFARTGDEPAVVEITGYGPTGTEYPAP